MSIKVGFMVVVPKADPAKHRSIVKTSELEVITVCVSNYREAVDISKELVSQGVTVLNLCGGFGHIGTAKIVKAVRGKASVGVSRSDTPPVLQGKSGDDIFDALEGL